jgi:hypothetical protein
MNSRPLRRKRTLLNKVGKKIDVYNFRGIPAFKVRYKSFGDNLKALKYRMAPAFVSLVELKKLL